jgi:hypothetical protein
MSRRILASRHFVAAALAMGTGMILFYKEPFPEAQLFLKLIAMRAPHALQSFRLLYDMALFTTPYMLYLGTLSALYVGTLKFRPRVVAGQLPRYPDPRDREDLFIVLGEVHNPRGMARDSRAWIIHWDRDFGSCWQWEKFVLHVPLCRANLVLQGARPRAAHRRNRPRS